MGSGYMRNRVRTSPTRWGGQPVTASSQAAGAKGALSGWRQNPADGHDGRQAPSQGQGVGGGRTDWTRSGAASFPSASFP